MLRTRLLLALESVANLWPSKYRANVSTLGDLLLYSLDELEQIAAEKGGIRTLLDEKRLKVYKASSPRGLFGVA